MFRLMSTRSLVTSSPSTTTPGVTYIARPQSLILRVGVVANIGIVERAPTSKKNPAPSDLFVTRKGFVEEVEQVVVQRHDFLHELHVLHQPDDVVREELDGWDGADAARIERRGVHMPSFHQAEHLARHAAHLQSLEIERTRERISAFMMSRDRAVPMQIGVRRSRFSAAFSHTPGLVSFTICFAKVDADQIVLEDVVVEHVFRGFAKIDNPLSHCRGLNAKSHILRIGCAGGMVVTTYSADTAGDEVSVARVFALHEDAVAAEYRRSAVTLDHFAACRSRSW